MLAMARPARHKGQRQCLCRSRILACESSNLRMRSEIVTALRKFIETEGLTQADAAKRLKVSQSRISDLTRGKISRFSLDALVNMVTDAGLEINIRIKSPSGRAA